MNKPVITAVNGAAARMGMSFAIAGDIIYAAEGASFKAAYTAAGLSPDGGMTNLLPVHPEFYRNPRAMGLQYIEIARANVVDAN